jgi:hypothetical protein
LLALGIDPRDVRRLLASSYHAGDHGEPIVSERELEEYGEWLRLAEPPSEAR